jgi:hypothetical protein
LLPQFLVFCFFLLALRVFTFGDAGFEEFAFECGQYVAVGLASVATSHGKTYLLDEEPAASTVGWRFVDLACGASFAERAASFCAVGEVALLARTLSSVFEWRTAVVAR